MTGMWTQWRGLSFFFWSSGEQKKWIQPKKVDFKEKCPTSCWIWGIFVFVTFSVGVVWSVRQSDKWGCSGQCEQMAARFTSLACLHLLTLHSFGIFACSFYFRSLCSSQAKWNFIWAKGGWVYFFFFSLSYPDTPHTHTRLCSGTHKHWNGKHLKKHFFYTFTPSFYCKCSKKFKFPHTAGFLESITVNSCRSLSTSGAAFRELFIFNLSRGLVWRMEKKTKTTTHQPPPR